MATRTRRSPGSIITAIAAVIAGIIVVGIILVWADANQRNTIVDFVLDLGRFFTRPFRDLFPQDSPKDNILVNWGIAAIAYLLLGALIARILRRS